MSLDTLSFCTKSSLGNLVSRVSGMQVLSIYATDSFLWYVLVSSRVAWPLVLYEVKYAQSCKSYRVASPSVAAMRAVTFSGVVSPLICFSSPCSL